MTDGLVFWFTGLSGAGKTTLANGCKERLISQGLKTAILDGDDVRRRLHRHLGFTEPEIKENNRLVCKLCETERQMADIVLVPIISPYRESRELARRILSPGFYEIYLHADIKELERRDTKLLYAQARSGEIDNLIGYSDKAPYELAEAPDWSADTGQEPTDETVSRLMNFILARWSEYSYFTSS
jgi:adenylyl-sulfate kinase